MSYLVLEDFKLSENFWLSEFQCNNPKKNPKEILIANGDDISKLQKIRDYFDKPLTICVAYRDPIHNKNVGGDPNSNHTRGQAYDIKIGKNDGSMPEVESSLMAYIAWKCGFDGVGIYDTFTHVDSSKRLFNKSTLYADIKTFDDLEKYILEKYGKISVDKTEEQHLKEEIKPVENEKQEDTIIQDAINKKQNEKLLFQLTKLQTKYNKLSADFDNLTFENMKLKDELRKYTNIENSLAYKLMLCIENIIKKIGGNKI